METIKPVNVVKIWGSVGTVKVDYRMLYYDVMKKSKMALYQLILVKNDAITTTFGTLNQNIKYDKNNLTRIQIFKFKMAD